MTIVIYLFMKVFSFYFIKKWYDTMMIGANQYFVELNLKNQVS